MKCPVCQHVLLGNQLETKLQTLQCEFCKGHWVKSFQYWKWRDAHGADLPALPALPQLADNGNDDSAEGRAKARLCPECGHFLLRYKVRHDIPFTIDQCGNCGGMWFDDKEWQVLKDHNLHDDVHFIFTQSWQRRVRQEESRIKLENQLRQTIGENDYDRVQQTKDWLRSHPHRHRMIAEIITVVEDEN